MEVISCELVVDGSGSGVVVRRGQGCTPADVVEMCRLVVAGDPVVRDGAADDGDTARFWRRTLNGQSAVPGQAPSQQSQAS